MIERRPLIYHRILKSQLVERAALDQVYETLFARLAAEYPETDSSFDSAEERTNDDDSDFDVSDDVSVENVFDGDEENGDDASNDDRVSLPDGDSSNFADLPVRRCRFENEMETLLPEELRRCNLINAWQADQLAHSKTRFTLDKYRIVDFIGLGGYGQVFLGRPKSDPVNAGLSEGTAKRKSDVAIKVLPLKRANEETVRRFLEEIQFVGKLNHPNIVQLINYSKDANVYYAVYEFIDGGDVRKLLDRYERLPVEMATYIVSEVAKSLQYLHEKRKCVHRDVKPGNILLSRKGKVKLTDFGLSVALDDSSVSFEENDSDGEFESANGSFPANSSTQISNANDSAEPNGEQTNAAEPAAVSPVKKIAGTPDYISPDQIRDPKNPSPLWDVYSLGCSFYFMVTGIVPFPSGTARQKMQAQLRSDPPEPRMFNQDLPVEISRLIMQMMAKKPEDRVQSVSEVVRRLSPWLPRFDRLNSIVADMLNDSNLDFWSPEYFSRLTLVPVVASSSKSRPPKLKKTFDELFDDSVASEFDGERTTFSPKDKEFYSVLSELETAEKIESPTVLPPVLDESPSSDESFLQNSSRDASKSNDVWQDLSYRENVNYILVLWILAPLIVIALILLFIAFFFCF